MLEFNMWNPLFLGLIVLNVVVLLLFIFAKNKNNASKTPRQEKKTESPTSAKSSITLSKTDPFKTVSQSNASASGKTDDAIRRSEQRKAEERRREEDRRRRDDNEGNEIDLGLVLSMNAYEDNNVADSDSEYERRVVEAPATPSYEPSTVREPISEEPSRSSGGWGGSGGYSGSDSSSSSYSSSSDSGSSSSDSGSSSYD